MDLDVGRNFENDTNLTSNDADQLGKYTGMIKGWMLDSCQTILDVVNNIESNQDLVKLLMFGGMVGMFFFCASYEAIQNWIGKVITLFVGFKNDSGQPQQVDEGHVTKAKKTKPKSTGSSKDKRRRRKH